MVVKYGLKIVTCERCWLMSDCGVADILNHLFIEHRQLLSVLYFIQKVQFRHYFHREYVYSVAVYQKYLTRLGELIISEPSEEFTARYIIKEFFACGRQCALDTAPFFSVKKRTRLTLKLEQELWYIFQ